MRRALPALLLSLLASCSAAQTTTQEIKDGLEVPKPAFDFQYGDWYLACNNLRTCYAAGYQPLDSSSSYPTVSVLLTRKAGIGAPVEAQFQIEDYGNDHPSKWARLVINDHDTGLLTLQEAHGDYRLIPTPEQTSVLLESLKRKSSIVIITPDLAKRYTLSDKGAAAVLLKMDEAQGRLNTAGALMRKGTQDEIHVLPPLPAPEITIPAIPATTSADNNLVDDATLRNALIASHGDGCEALIDPKNREEFHVERLTEGKSVVDALCDQAAHDHETHGIWLINSRPPYAPTLITKDAAHYEKGQITFEDSGGCSPYSEWNWNGHEFVLTSNFSPGICITFMGGASWDIPLFVSDIQRMK